MFCVIGSLSKSPMVTVGSGFSLISHPLPLSKKTLDYCVIFSHKWPPSHRQMGSIVSFFVFPSSFDLYHHGLMGLAYKCKVKGSTQETFLWVLIVLAYYFMLETYNICSIFWRNKRVWCKTESTLRKTFQL